MYTLALNKPYFIWLFLDESPNVPPGFVGVPEIWVPSLPVPAVPTTTLPPGTMPAGNGERFLLTLA